MNIIIIYMTIGLELTGIIKFLVDTMLVGDIALNLVVCI
jgi:hypothetical protein